MQQMGDDQSGSETGRTLILDELLGYALRRAQLKVFKDFEEAMREYAIRPAQFSALVVVEEMPGVTQSELAQRLAIDPPRVVNLVHDLEKRGYAVRVRCKRDRRSHGIFLTKPGEALVTTLKRLSVESDARASVGLSEDERAHLLRLLRKIYDTPEAP
ncbi:MarR family winged helix-turn-helix transcriptional regulator [Larsenimonas suaedae]|uniref:MarR family winged helix-turn-helix transcriptional regulator n=1 Tax=Larsenimonas suaedae TaxID=1851019 RepID=A0ABU1GRX6_9GAMM|nr:MarR family winged helix-turn-helix transcriptional regulator [Larsenimonas suaedae]MCM2972434.1 MarR family winged helix-turn-helix transcriptional regulator [Larsenimonas suaedae]MDR5894770.1 MarR family winged helix-turn-helix transcriptional regulator [Larsenimonas suaedae]